MDLLLELLPDETLGDENDLGRLFATDVRPKLPFFLQSGQFLGDYPVAVLNRFYIFCRAGTLGVGMRQEKLTRVIFMGDFANFLLAFKQATGWSYENIQKGSEREADENSGLICSECRRFKRVQINGICEPCRKKRAIRLARLNDDVRRARELAALGSHTDQEWKALLVAADFKCLRCGSTKRITKDHVQPISKGGTHNIDNIQPLCIRCNSWKHNRTIDFRDNLRKKPTEVSQSNDVPRSDTGREGRQRSVHAGPAGSRGDDRNGYGDWRWLMEQDQASAVEPPAGIDDSPESQAECAS